MAGLGACGGGGESSTTATEADVPRAQPPAEVRAHNEEVQEEYERRQQVQAPAPEEQEAERVATGFYSILGEDEAEENRNRVEVDSTSFCELMSEEAVAQTIRYAQVSSGIQRKWDCESAVDLLVLRSKRAGGLEDVQQAEVIGVNARGEKATATVRFGSGPVTSLPMVKEDGEWKLAPSAVPTVR